MNSEVIVEFYPRYNRRFEQKLVIERDNDLNEFHYLLVIADDVVIPLSHAEYLKVVSLFNGAKR